MLTLNIPKDLQEDVREYMMHNSIGMENQQELELFLKMLSPTLRNNLTKYIFHTAFIHNDFFKNYE